MPEISLSLIVLILFSLAMTFIFLYSLVQLQLVYLYKRRLRKKIQPMEALTGSEISDYSVTVQLPVYNEKYVVERLLKAVSELDFPRNRFEIQILDDSTDETSEIIERMLSSIRALEIDIKHIRRSERTGFKAGALAFGLQQCKGEFIAIFDADFVPARDFLSRTMPHFSDTSVGMVQSRWEHVNENYNLLTKLQAFGLDAHFTIEQAGRNEGGHFINFNGTAGIWRKSCIIDSGGWQADTLTEDLDLSYRAQIRGWKFKYLEDFGAPAELPAEMNALKTQQFRWTKGAAQCSRKNLKALIISSDFPLSTKINGTFHLLNSSLFICILLASILSFPVLLIRNTSGEYSAYYNLGVIFLLSFFILTYFYYSSGQSKIRRQKGNIYSFMSRFPIFLSVSMGLAMHNGMAALEGLLGIKSAFIRTPKFNIIDHGDSWKAKLYRQRKISWRTIAEVILAAYFLIALSYSVEFLDYSMMPFLLMLSFGYTYVASLSILHARSL